jgi:diguanylate cyclase (GGDEF)-like protein
MSTSKKNFIGIAGILSGFLFTVLVSLQLHLVQRQSIDQDFTAQVKTHARSIQREMELNVEALYSLKGLFDGSEDVTAEEFRLAASTLLFRHGDILSFEWIPLVSHENRALVEAELRQRVPQAVFTEPAPSGGLVEAGSREFYFPSAYVEPIDDRMHHLGFDHAFEPTRRDLLIRSRDNDALSLSSKILMPNQADGVNSVLLTLPIYKGPTTTLGQRRDSFMGAVAAQVDLQQLIRTALDASERWIDSYEILDVTEDDDHTTLLHFGNPERKGAFTQSIRAIGGRSWVMQADIDPEIYLYRQTFMPVLVLVAGTGLFGILAFTLYQSNRQNKLIEAEVIERTRSLDEANKKLSQLSTTDDLTGLQNRRSADNNFRIEWQRHIRDGAKLSVMMIDIDYFKHYNDTYGHLAGDQCLKAVANSLDAEINRPADTIARYGGEEFLAILPNTAEDSETVAERCRSSVERLRIAHERSTISDYVTISIGVATMVPDKTIDMMDLIEMADRALYEAKAQGRNRVCMGS